MQDGTGRKVTRSEATVKAYRERYLQLVGAAGVEAHNIPGAIDWFVGQHDRWAPSTVFQYRASLRQAIEDAAAAGTVRADFDQLERRLKEGPLARRHGSRRTSARKRKSISENEFVRLTEFLRRAGGHPDNALAAEVLDHNVKLFLRPVEWQTAVIRNERLVVRNAKATNGRALGPERQRDLRDYGTGDVKRLRELLATIRGRAKGQNFPAFWARLSSRVARACKKLRIKRVSLYTTRHVGMANAKSWMSPEEVAASAGHKSTATATSHYAKRRTGWGSKAKRVARPSPEDVEKVIKTSRWSRESHLSDLARRAESEPEQEETFSTFRM